MTEDNTYATGELANACGTTVRTVQYYEQKGLLAPRDIPRAAGACTPMRTRSVCASSSC